MSPADRRNMHNVFRIPRCTGADPFSPNPLYYNVYWNKASLLGELYSLYRRCNINAGCHKKEVYANYRQVSTTNRMEYRKHG